MSLVKGNFCGTCGKSEAKRGEEMKKCSGCKLLYYCNRDCQRKDWEKHGDKCKKIKNHLTELAKMEAELRHYHYDTPTPVDLFETFKGDFINYVDIKCKIWLKI